LNLLLHDHKKSFLYYNSFLNKDILSSILKIIKVCSTMTKRTVTALEIHTIIVSFILEVTKKENDLFHENLFA